MTTFGRQVLVNTGSALQVMADGTAEWVTGGSTIDWTTINPVTTATLLAIEGITVPAGSGYLRYGQVLCRIRGTQRFSIMVDATAGTFTVSVTANGSTQTTTAQVYNVSAANLQIALRLLSNVNSDATVTLASTTYTLNFPTGGTVSITTNAGLLTGNTATASVAVSGATFTFTESGGAGGLDTYTLNVTAGGSTQSTTALAYGATTAQVQTALRLLTNTGLVSVTGTGGAAAASTITFPVSIGTVVLSTTNAGAETGVVAQVVVGDQGKFGPYDPLAADGRQLLTRGDCGIINQTILQLGPVNGLGVSESSDNPGLINGGRLWKSRILAVASGASLAAGPTFSTLEAGFPRISYALMF